MPTSAPGTSSRPIKRARHGGAKVGVHRLCDPRVAHFHRDIAIVDARAVDLSDRCAGDGLLRERRQQLLGMVAVEIFTDHRFHLVERCHV